MVLFGIFGNFSPFSGDFYTSVEHISITFAAPSLMRANSFMLEYQTILISYAQEYLRKAQSSLPANSSEAFYIDLALDTLEGILKTAKMLDDLKRKEDLCRQL